ncbi:recombinase family protein [Salipaludibacillus sp. CUR1]|uniref:recombinase family protein n=1 Tax=Salipaludibacillus sp. CUR1 TaxID=2820003 RepID=UPI001E2B7FCF|nr:recombinase family protein [Salipaludibacillus sp. CUR1]MCE7793445.1 recombinase family protein [Salipaludibacillus sp. CUR1]
MSRKLGYMRVSTNREEQKFDRQEAQLSECDYIYKDRMSGAKKDRPALMQMLEDLQENDLVIITSIDRLSRSTADLLNIVQTIKDKGATIRSISDSWLDTTEDNPLNDFLLTIVGALSEMERKMINKRVNEGIAVAKQNGVMFGRPKSNPHKVNYAIELYNKGEHTSKQICEITGINRSTLYRKLKQVR